MALVTELTPEASQLARLESTTELNELYIGLVEKLYGGHDACYMPETSMMPNDYIMRIVQQFIQMLVSIIQKRKAGKHGEAIGEVQTASASLFKDRPVALLLLLSDPKQIPDLFGDSVTGEIDTERCVLAADLLHELALSQIRRT